MAKEYYDVPASPYPTSGDITIQGEVNPIQKYMAGGETKIGDYMIYPRSLVFTYTGAAKNMTGSRRLGNKQVRVGAATNVFSSFRGMAASGIDGNTIRFVGVAFEGIANGKDAKNFPVECGRLAVLVSGATTIYCASKEVKDAKFGDILCWEPQEDQHGRVQHGDDDFRFVGLRIVKNNDVLERLGRPRRAVEFPREPSDFILPESVDFSLGGEGSLTRDERVRTRDNLERSSLFRPISSYGTVSERMQTQGWPMWISDQTSAMFNPFYYYPTQSTSESFGKLVFDTIKEKNIDSVIPENASIHVRSPHKEDIVKLGSRFPNVLTSEHIVTFPGFDFAHKDEPNQDVYQIQLKGSNAQELLTNKNKIQSFLGKNSSFLEHPTHVSFGADLHLIKSNIDQIREPYDNGVSLESVESVYGVTQSQLGKLDSEERQFLERTLPKNVSYDEINHIHANRTTARVMEHPLIVKEMMDNIHPQSKQDVVLNSQRLSGRTSTQLGLSTGRTTIHGDTPLLERETSVNFAVKAEHMNVIGMVLDYDEVSKSLRILMEPGKYI